MSKYFKEKEEMDDGAFIAIRYNDILPPDHEAYYIQRFIKGLDTSEFENKYKVGEGQKGRAPKGIRMMLGVILYAVYKRIYSTHQIWWPHRVPQKCRG